MTDPNTYRYRAFISYSQLDRAHAKRIHSALETYRVPKGIEATLQPNRRLGRFFRDDDEMGASTDLGGALHSALESSENLIVICSPNAARSKWVNQEILHFKNRGGGDRIFAVIVDGTPNSPDPQTNCFPPALVSGAEGDGGPTTPTAEPLAVDLRKERFARTRLRLVAGLLKISFDTLWQREKRRTLKRRAIATAATLALSSVIVLLGVRWLTERGRVHAQTLDRTLGIVRDDLASERVKTALGELQRLNADGETGDVEQILNTTLSWMTTPTELFKEIKGPALFSNESQLFFLAPNGNYHLLSIHQPYRRILSSNKRWLLIIGADEAVVIDVANGNELARTPNSQISWNGETFETGSGLLLVVGRYSGTTNGSFRESFLVFSPQQKSLKVFSEHWTGEARNQYRFIQPLYVSSDCRSFGVVTEDYSFEDPQSAPGPTDMIFLSTDANGLKVTSPAESIADWQPLGLFATREEQLGLKRYEIGGVVSGVGCTATSADSKIQGAQGLAGLIRPIGMGTFWESERRWKVIGDVEPPRNDLVSDSGVSESNPCTDEHPCSVQDPEDDKEFPPFNIDKVPITRPRGVPRNDNSFERVNDVPVYAYFTQLNSAFVSGWCRSLNSKTVCLSRGTPAEFFEDQTDMDLRSNTGRFIFYPSGAVAGFRLYDLQTMRNVTPRGPEFVASTHWADFSLDDKRLFLAMNGRLLVFEPRSDTTQWQPVSDGRSVSIPALSGSNERDKVAALLALDDNNLIVVRSTGIISRFDWRTGQQSWGRTINNIGEINHAVISKNRRFLLLVGRGGGRLLDTRDGLVLSGALVPPPAMDGGVEMLQCFNQAFVSDTAAFDISCGEKIFRREPTTFKGDVRSRLQEIISNDFSSGSK